MHCDHEVIFDVTSGSKGMQSTPTMAFAMVTWLCETSCEGNAAMSQGDVLPELLRVYVA